MGILDKLRGELIDIVEWIEDDDLTIAYRFERYGNEIKNGAQLTVREGQTAVFVNEGQLADVFESGMYELTTRNLPILSTLKGWKYGFESPFKAEIIFVSSRIITGFGWGTPSPFRLRDPEYGILETTARGHFSFHVIDPGNFIKNVVGTDGEFTKDEIRDRLRKKFVTEAISAIAESGKSFYQIAGQYHELSLQLKKRVEVAFFDHYGIALDDTSIQSIDLSERSVQKVESRDEVMFHDGRITNYERRARADAMVGMANNPGGGGMGAQAMGMGMGLAMANQMNQAIGGVPSGQAPPDPAATPPPPPSVSFYVLVNGQQVGPVDQAAVSQMIQQGAVAPQTLVWKPGMDEWAQASEVAEVAMLITARASGSAPPPPPPPPG